MREVIRKVGSQLFFLTIVCVWIAVSIASQTWPEKAHLFGTIALITVGCAFVAGFVFTVLMALPQPTKDSRISISETVKIGVEKGRASARKKGADQT